MRILGLSAFYHDAAAALIEDGRIVAAAQEERFSRKKHDASFPAQSVTFCLERAGICLDDIDRIAFYDKPFIKFERLLETYLAFAPHGFRSFRMAMPLWLKEKLFQKRLLIEALASFGDKKTIEPRLAFSEHHFSHAASAFYPSPFQRAAILTMDGVGEWTTTSLAIGDGEKIEIKKEIFFPHSIGLLYSAFTYYTGFKVNSGEYKLMGLAPYGTPHYAQAIYDNLIDLKEDGSFRLNLDYFDYCTGLTMTNERFDSLFGAPPRKEGEPIEQRHMDLAASIQVVTEEVVLKLCRSIARETGEKNLCLAGGVALNCVANGKIVREGIFDQVWVQPAAGDAGGAVGAGLAVYHWQLGQKRIPAAQGDAMSGGYLGPEFSDQEISDMLQEVGAVYEKLPDDTLFDAVADALAEGNAVGWFQGAMEFGPRALGNRSILADARSPAMQKTLNLKIKYRESFRPFAPACLAEEAQDWFNTKESSPYMLVVSDVKEEHCRALDQEEGSRQGLEKLAVARSSIPAITHVDGSARLQTVHKESNPRFHALLSAFKERTGCPVLVNTSFNVRGEPIVCTPMDAFRCFMGTEMDVLVLGHYVLQKEKQDDSLKVSYKGAFELD